MADQGHDETDKKLKALERKLKKTYKQAAEETEQKLNDYLSAFASKDVKKRLELAAGEITQAEYNKWRTGQIMMSQRWAEMRDTLAQDMTNVNEKALSMVNGYLPDVYALNHDYATFQIEQASLMNTSYTLYDRDTVERIVKENPKLIPKPKLKQNLDVRWNKQNFQSGILQGILQGESIEHLASRVALGVSTKDYNAAVRNARTATTSAENAGRLEAMKRAQSMGIKQQKEWMAALDDRTRESHRYVDGEKVDIDKKFSNGLMYPGDPSGPAREVWNCRCTMVTAVVGVDEDANWREDVDLGGMTYGEWRHSRAYSKHYGESKAAYKKRIENEIQRKATIAAGGKESGAISGAKKTEKEQNQHAKLYYEEVRNRKPYADAKRIAGNVEGFTVDEIEEIRQHLFIREQPRDGGLKRFEEDYEQAQAWQRLVEGKNIWNSDIVLLEHERYELTIMRKYGYTYEKAHDLTERLYNYVEALDRDLREREKK
ncbi:MAG: phage head morphogenesis protein [Lachnospiraceae bacterium]|nr:phage head morphogenesis protein [Lachnospiraceae bacterium]